MKLKTIILKALFLLTIKAHAWCSKHGLSVMFWRISRKWSGRGTSRSTRHTRRMSIRRPSHDRIATSQRPIISWHHGGWNWRAGATKVTIEIGFWGDGGRGCCGRLKAWHGRWGVKPGLIKIRIVHCSCKKCPDYKAAILTLRNGAKTSFWLDVVLVQNTSQNSKTPYRWSKISLHKNFKLVLDKNVGNQTYPEISRSQK